MTHNLRLSLRAAVTTSLLALPVAAQVAHLGVHTNSGGTPIGRETSLPSAAFPAGNSVSTARYPLPALNSIFLGANRPSGGVAVDQTNGDVWTASITSVFPVVGNGISVESNPNYRPTTTGAAGLGAIIPFGTAVEGLAIDSTGSAGFGGKVLFLVDSAANLNVVTATIPPALVAGPIALPGMGGTQVSGVGYDPISATIWVSTRLGRIVNFTPTGVPTGLGRSVTGFTFPIVGCTVNSSTSAGFLAPPFCSTQRPGDFNVCVVDLTGAIFDSVTGNRIPGALLPGETPFGLGSSADPQTLLGAGTSGVSMTLSQPLVNALVPSATLQVSGLPLGSTGVIAFDVCPLPVGIPAGGGTFWLNQFSPTFVVTPFAPAGTTFAFNLGVVATAVHGTQFTAQTVVLTPALLFSDALVMTVGAP